MTNQNLTIKDLINAGIIIQERATNITILSEIDDLENLEPKDLTNRNYYSEQIESIWRKAKYNLYLEYKEYGVTISYENFESLMKSWETINDVIDFIKRFGE